MTPCLSAKGSSYTNARTGKGGPALLQTETWSFFCCESIGACRREPVAENQLIGKR